jgi:hypothetical protein
MGLQLNSGVTNEAASYAGTAITASDTDDWGMSGFVYRDTAGSTDLMFGIWDDLASPSIFFDFRVASGNYAISHSAQGSFAVTAAGAAWTYVAFSTTGAIGTSLLLHGTTTTLTSVTSAVGSPGTFDNIYIGNWPTGGFPFKGRYAHLRFWAGYAPTQADFEAEMVSATAVHTGNLYAAYEFPNNSGTYLNDSSGNGRHLTGSNLDFATNYIAGPLSASGTAAKLAAYYQNLRS